MADIKIVDTKSVSQMMRLLTIYLTSRRTLNIRIDWRRNYGTVISYLTYWMAMVKA